MSIEENGPVSIWMRHHASRSISLLIYDVVARLIKVAKREMTLTLVIVISLFAPFPVSPLLSLSGYSE